MERDGSSHVVGNVLANVVAISRPGNDNRQVGDLREDRWECGHQHGEAFARLFDPPEEK